MFFLVLHCHFAKNCIVDHLIMNMYCLWGEGNYLPVARTINGADILGQRGPDENNSLEVVPRSTKALQLDAVYCYTRDVYY